MVTTGSTLQPAHLVRGMVRSWPTLMGVLYMQFIATSLINELVPLSSRNIGLHTVAGGEVNAAFERRMRELPGYDVQQLCGNAASAAVADAVRSVLQRCCSVVRLLCLSSSLKNRSSSSARHGPWVGSSGSVASPDNFSAQTRIERCTYPYVLIHHPDSVSVYSVRLDVKLLMNFPLPCGVFTANSIGRPSRRTPPPHVAKGSRAHIRV